MLIDNTILYEQAYKIEINDATHAPFYIFDYDERSYEINMAFQHYHPFYEMCIFLDEQASYIIDGKWHDIQCCDIVVIHPLILHKTQYPQGDPNKRLIIKFAIPVNIPGMEQSFKNLLSLFETQTVIFRFDGEYKLLILNKINEIYYMSKSPNDFTNLMIHQKFIEFLSTIFLYQDKNRYSNRPLLSNISAKIYDITSFIHNHFQEELSLDTLSKRFYISNYYLSHQFKKVTGFTLTEYIQMTRIRNAQTLLLSTKQSITTIAFQCGFTSFSQFNRVFNKISHTSPSKFRKMGSFPEISWDG